MNDIIGTIIGVMIGGILGYTVGPYVSERLKLRMRLAETYLAPFREWCSHSYGELGEFSRTYLQGDYSTVSDLQVIIDYRELHETLRYAPRWMGKIEKEDREVADSLVKLMEIVDVFWHSLEDQYSQELPTKKDYELFEADLKALSRSKRQEIAGEICKHLRSKEQAYSDANTSRILDYLIRKVP